MPEESGKYEIPDEARPRRCHIKECGELVYIVTNQRGTKMPVDPDGTPHWKTCKDPNEVHRRQTARFDMTHKILAEEQRELIQMLQKPHMWGRLSSKQRSFVLSVDNILSSGRRLSDGMAERLRALIEGT
jgi:hypothetical protein